MSEQQELQAKTAIVHAMRPQERLASFIARVKANRCISFWLMMPGIIYQYELVIIAPLAVFLSVPTFGLFPATRLETDMRLFSNCRLDSVHVSRLLHVVTC